MHNPPNNAILRTPNHSLHLHALDNNKRLVLLHALPLLDLDTQHLARHGCEHAVGHVFDAEGFSGPRRQRQRQPVLRAALEERQAVCVADEGCREARVREEGREGVC